MNIHEIVVKIMSIHDFVVDGWGILHPLSINIVKLQIHVKLGLNVIVMLMNIHDFDVTMITIHTLRLVGEVYSTLYLGISLKVFQDDS